MADNNYDIKLTLSPDAKKEFLKKLGGRIIKILYLIEDENKGESMAGTAESYILGQIFELNSANILFDNTLTDVLIKLNSVLHYREAEFKQVRKQLLEAKGIVDHLYKQI
jgi:hypothetical protein